MTTIFNQKPLHQDSDILSLALYGYACFTTFLVQNKKVKGLHLHLERLINDAFEIFGQSPDKNEILKNILAFLGQQEANYYGGVRVTIFPSNFSLSNPGDFKIFNILVTGRKIESTNTSPINIASIEAKRTCPLQKTSNIIANLKARIEAQEKGAQDALMLHDDLITEGTTWNIFFGTGKSLVTPSIQSEILPGIARKLLIEATVSSDYKIIESEIKITEIEKYEYCFISNSLIGLRSIRRIDNIIYDTVNPNIKYLQQKLREIPDENIIS